MSILPIRVFPDPILRQRAQPVTKFDAAVQQLGKDMLETMRNAGGVGLAANQVGELKRVVTIEVPEHAPMLLVNPEIVSATGHRMVEEGCLSVPGYTGLVNRALRVSAKYLDEHGGRLQIRAEELLAQAIQHEIDHLNGILFLDHLKEHEDLQKHGVSHNDPHWHDVGYEVHVVNSSEVTAKDASMVETLHAVAKYSELSGQSLLREVRYDLGRTRDQS